MIETTQLTLSSVYSFTLNLNFQNFDQVILQVHSKALSEAIFAKIEHQRILRTPLNTIEKTNIEKKFFDQFMA